MTYTCDAGYTLQGSNSRSCQSNGQWSGSVPQCTCKLLLIRGVEIHGVFSTLLLQQSGILGPAVQWVVSLLQQIKYIAQQWIKHTPVSCLVCGFLTSHWNHGFPPSNWLRWSWYSYKWSTQSLQYNLQLCSDLYLRCRLHTTWIKQ